MGHGQAPGSFRSLEHVADAAAAALTGGWLPQTKKKPLVFSCWSLLLIVSGGDPLVYQQKESLGVRNAYEPRMLVLLPRSPTA